MAMVLGRVPVLSQTLTAGDLAIVGIDANLSTCDGNSNGRDEISFICFKQINTGLRLWFTDNGYERAIATKWGDTEGVFQLQRTGGSIAAGTVITFRIVNNVVSYLNPDAGWSFTNLNGSNTFNLNTMGDQLFIFQANTGAAFNNPGLAHDATFVNCTLLYGFSTLGPPNSWVAANDPQRSGLPPGSLCFSMAPSAGTDFIKYVPASPDAFPTYTTRTQRQWIIEFDDPTRWLNESSCANYNTPSVSSPNYASFSPPFVFPIGAGGFVNGVWTGAKNSDWFDCRNWDDAEVPTSTSNVVIDGLNNPVNHCVIGTTTTITPDTLTTARCQTLVVKSAAGAPKNLTITNNKTLGVGGTALVQRYLVAGAPVSITVSNGRFFSNGLSMQGTGAGLLQGTFRSELVANTVKISGPVLINNGGYLDLQGAAVGGTLELTGNYTNNDGPAAFDELYSTMKFSGNSAQLISAPFRPEHFGGISMVKSANNLSLSTSIDISGDLNLQTGLILPGTDSLTVTANGTTSAANDASYVQGPVYKVGNANFTFPVGKGGFYRPATLAGLTASVTDVFKVEYLRGDPHTDIGSPIEAPPLDHVSYCEYWTIDRSVGTPSAFVNLSWKAPASCGVTNGSETQMRVARWDGAMWRNAGNGGTSGNYLSGSVTALGSQTVFSPVPSYWTLASVSTDNPLPIELLWFSAKPDGGRVTLEWATATERDNDYFTVERSVDGFSFEPVLRKDGAGNSSSAINYSDLDPSPLPGLSYYRLRQTDFDGASTLSDVVAVYFRLGAAHDLSVAWDGTNAVVFHSFPVGSSMEVMDMTGRPVWRGTAISEGRLDVALDGVGSGAYVLRMSDGERVESTRFTR